MTGFPLLTLLWVLPAVAALVVVALPSALRSAARSAALIVFDERGIGNGLLLREALRQGLGIARALGYEEIIIWTQDERLVREAGCEAYMSKPIQMSAFIAEVKRLTGTQTATPARRPSARRATR